ncbi:hypothetical protein BDV39DRAFT_168057 [Aspergillus sergii]|uniref:Uncharacterized protein n=1 Tax=Aspergillus sergii TaxID=1034303 RepID=A0A5N6XH01_9EURO|nr:hypothetical protein BDV39DRAFT_168057 [Aspergillus sergii]
MSNSSSLNSSLEDSPCGTFTPWADFTITVDELSVPLSRPDRLEVVLFFGMGLTSFLFGAASHSARISSILSEKSSNSSSSSS